MKDKYPLMATGNGKSRFKTIKNVKFLSNY
jgi:hypothetical protein